MHKTPAVGLIIVLGALFSPQLSAQCPRPLLQGYIVFHVGDKSIPIPSAEIIDSSSKSSAPATTDSTGHFMLCMRNDVQPGTAIRLYVRAKGYDSYAEDVMVGPLPLTISLSPTKQKAPQTQRDVGKTNTSTQHDSTDNTKSPIDALSGLGWMIQPGDGASLQFSDIYKHISMRQSAPYFRVINRPFSVNVVGAKSLDGVAGLRDAKQLTKLSLTGAELSDLSELQYLVNLTKLTISQTSTISDLSPLRALVNLTELGFDSPAIRDLTQIQDLRRITMLSISGTQVSDLSPLRNFHELRSLTLNGTRVVDLSPIDGVETLEELRISAQQVPSLPRLRLLPRFKKLSIFDPGAVDLSPVGELAGLRELSIDGPVALDIGPLRRLGGLTSLALAPLDFDHLMQVKEILALSELHELRKLILFQVEVSDLGFMGGLPKLTDFTVINAPLSNITGIENAKALEHLNFTNTQVFETSPLLSLPNLRDLYVVRTPARSDVLTLLEQRGVKVHR